MSKIKSPLKKRVPRELLGEWHKYLVIALFLIIMIGFISGMYVANNSMLTSAEKKKIEYNLEDGSFELDDKASEEMLNALEKGEKADVKQFYLDKAYEEADKEVKKAVDEAFPEEFIGSDEYNEALDDAIEEAHKEVEKEVDEEYDKAADKYDLENPDYKAVPIKIYENFYKDVEEDRDGDGEKDGTVRVFKDRTDVDLYSIHEGEMPKADNEIAIDRMHADNTGIKVGYTITV